MAGKKSGVELRKPRTSQTTVPKPAPVEFDKHYKYCGKTMTVTANEKKQNKQT